MAGPANGDSVKIAVAEPRCSLSQLCQRSVYSQKHRLDYDSHVTENSPRVGQRAGGETATQETEDEERRAVGREGTRHLEEEVPKETDDEHWSPA